MRTLLRWAFITAMVVHGLIHLLGAAEGFELAEIERLAQPISSPMGFAWLAAATAILVAAVAMAVDARGWWLTAATAAVISQAVIFTSFSDAAVGSVANVLLLLAAGYGYASRGPHSFRAAYHRAVAAALETPPGPSVITETDLVGLPAPVAAYLRRTGALGQPRVTSFRMRLHGRIRPGPDRPWMAYTAEQTSTCGAHPARLFLMDATMFGLPVAVYHRFVEADASMRGMVLSLFPVVDAQGHEMARAETVTLFNDLCLFAPAGLVDAPVTWEVLGERRVRGTYTNGDHTISAELVFNEHHELVDFVSDDRLAADADGRWEPRRWSTPIQRYAQVGTIRLAVEGEARWQPENEEPFTYIELHLDDLNYNVESPTDSKHPATAGVEVGAVRRRSRGNARTIARRRNGSRRGSHLVGLVRDRPRACAGCGQPEDPH